MNYKLHPLTHKALKNLFKWNKCTVNPQKCQCLFKDYEREFLIISGELENAIDVSVDAFRKYDTDPKDEKLTYSEIMSVSDNLYSKKKLTKKYISCFFISRSPI